jgi:hypothetical protein
LGPGAGLRGTGRASATNNIAFSPPKKLYTGNPYAFLMQGSTATGTASRVIIQRLRGKLEELAHERLAYKQAMLLTCKLLERYTTASGTNGGSSRASNRSDSRHAQKLLTVGTNSSSNNIDTDTEGRKSQQLVSGSSVKDGFWCLFPTVM